MSPIESSDADRYPLLSEAGQRMIQRLREHPNAPFYRNQSGNRLDATDLAYAKQATVQVLSAEIDWNYQHLPNWLPSYLTDTLQQVPRYREYDQTIPFEDFPTTCRADFGRDIAAYVPDSVSIERLINFQTSGATGHPLEVPSHPRVAAGYLAYHRRALKRFGVTLTAKHGEVGVVLLGFQQTCFTYVSVTPEMDEAGLAKINLHPNEWRSPTDRAAYLEDLNPEVIAGDPISFHELLRINPVVRPKAILSTSMTLLDGLRNQLSTTFACPVLDLYSLNEAGPVAVFDPNFSGHVLLQPRMYVEILDSKGNKMPEGERGEITLTGGFNFCLPLLRYRTGDFASLHFTQGEPVLHTLEGRPLIRFLRPDGIWINNVDVTHTLRPLPLARFALHQQEDASFDFSVEGSAHAVSEAQNKLAILLGAKAIIHHKQFPASPDKTVQYTSVLSNHYS